MNNSTFNAGVTLTTGNFRIHGTGTLTNKLPVDLEDIYLLYADKAYQIAKQWPGSKANAEPPPEAAQPATPAYSPEVKKGTPNPTSVSKKGSPDELVLELGDFLHR